MIELKNITKSYGKGKNQNKILKDLNVKFNNKGFVSILGPSGCGKTTLLNILGGLDVPENGEMVVDDVNTIEFTENDWDCYRNGYVGFVFQEFNIIPNLNVYQNIEIKLRLSKKRKKERTELIKDVLKKVGLTGYEKKKPNQLSGGEKQRVAIARALVNETKVILADEPTGSLDSVSAIEIMNILKEVSKENLVIMVTHNEKLAIKFSDDIVEMIDGRINTELKKGSNVEETKYKKNKVHMPFVMSLGMSINNMVSKLLRTFLTILAGSIGIAAIAIVLTVTSGVKTYISDVQKRTLENNPIVISSSSKTYSVDKTVGELVKFSNDDKILIGKSLTVRETVDNMDGGLVNHINNMNKDLYSVIDYSRSVEMRIIKKTGDKYYSISNYFNEMIGNNDFMESQYDVISGTLPKKYNEIAIVVDEYNRISSYTLKALGFDVSLDYYLFEDVIGQTYRVVDNNDCYIYKEGVYRFSGNYRTMYENSNIELTITAIMRPKEDNIYSLYSNCILYTPELTDKIYESAIKSDIVQEQISYGLTKDVTTGQPFIEDESGSVKYTKEYQYENSLFAYGARIKINSVSIYSETFENRINIQKYVKSYDKYNSLEQVSYRDRINDIATEYASFLDVLTKILMILATTSLLVSCIMIGVITYISVMERTREIGILRSIGARRIDIVQIFSVEIFIIGVFAGILGIFIAYCVKSPINVMVQEIIKQNISKATDVAEVDLIDYKVLLLIELIVGSSLVCLISGLLPAIVGSMKKPIDALKTTY